MDEASIFRGYIYTYKNSYRPSDFFVIFKEDWNNYTYFWDKDYLIVRFDEICINYKNIPQFSHNLTSFEMMPKPKPELSLKMIIKDGNNYFGSRVEIPDYYTGYLNVFLLESSNIEQEVEAYLVLQELIS